MADSATQDWDRLADFVKARRTALGLNNMREMARHAETMGIEITDRTLGTLERGGRVNGSTLAKVENILEWEPGSARRVLAGGQPAVKGEQIAAPQPSRPAFDDPVEQATWESIQGIRYDDDPAEDERIKRRMIAIYLRGERRERSESEGHRQAG